MSASDTHTWLARMVVRRVLRLEMILCQWLLKVCCALKFGALTEALPKLALEVLGACKKASSKIMHSAGLRIPSDNILKISKAKDLIKTLFSMQTSGMIQYKICRVAIILQKTSEAKQLKCEEELF